jgi:hypothetical protein
VAVPDLRQAAAVAVHDLDTVGSGERELPAVRRPGGYRVEELVRIIEDVREGRESAI